MLACEASLEMGKSVIIDNTNKTEEQRSRYTAIAKKCKVPVRIFVFDTTKERCMHNNK
jgi:predicted kinase